MRGRTGGGQGGGANPSCHLPNPSITFLISLPLPLLHFACQPPFSLNCISVSLRVKFSACPFSVSLHYSLHSISIRLSFLSLLPFFSPSPPPPSLSPSVSPIKTRYYAPTPNRRRSPPSFSGREKVKINKTAIFFRFMCHGQKKYNHECVERVDEATGRDGGRNSGGKNNDGGEKSSGFASGKINYLINSVRVYLCLCSARRYEAK